MHTFGLFIGAVVVSLAISRLLSFLCHGLVWRALNHSPRRLRTVGPLLKVVCLVILAGGIALAWALLGNPVYGLGVIFLVPALLAGVVKYLAHQQSQCLERSAIAYFHALRGLIQAGLGLPYALFHLTESVPSSFSRALRPFLDRFEEGQTLENCLERFRGRMGLGLTGICLTVLRMAYREGLPLAPFLDRILPVLEAEQRARDRLSALRKSLAVQAAVAFATPWTLLAVMAVFQPQLVAHFLRDRLLEACLAVAVIWESVGIWVLWKVSVFY